MQQSFAELFYLVKMKATLNLYMYFGNIVSGPSCDF